MNHKYLDYARRKYRQSTKASLIARRLVVTEIDNSALKKFKTKEEQTKHLATLDF